MLHARTVWLILVALTLDGFGLSAAPAIAQTTYPLKISRNDVRAQDRSTPKADFNGHIIRCLFSANYDTSSISSFIRPNIAQSFPSWESTDAPYSLNHISGLVYGEADFANGTMRLTSDPTTLNGSEGLPLGYIVLEGSGSDKLFATNSGSSTFDFVNGKASAMGTFTIIGGDGRFSGATGELAWQEELTLPPITGGTATGTATVNGFFVVSTRTKNQLRYAGQHELDGSRCSKVSTSTKP